MHVFPKLVSIPSNFILLLANMGETLYTFLLHLRKNTMAQNINTPQAIFRLGVKFHPS